MHAYKVAITTVSSYNNIPTNNSISVAWHLSELLRTHRTS